MVAEETLGWSHEKGVWWDVGSHLRAEEAVDADGEGAETDQRGECGQEIGEVGGHGKGRDVG